MTTEKKVKGVSSSILCEGVETPIEDERVEELELAKEKILEAIEIITFAVVGTEQELMAEAYILAHLRGWAFGKEDTSIDRLIETLKRKR